MTNYLVDNDGKARLGYFNERIEVINYDAFDYRTPLYKKASRWQKHFHVKQFQFYGGVSDKVIFGCAFADTRYFAMAFVYCFNPEDGKFWEKTLRSPLSAQCKMSNSPTEGESTFESGKFSILQSYRKENDNFIKRLKVEGPGVDIDSSMLEPGSYQPLMLNTHTAHNGWTYAQKTAGLPITGHCNTPIGSFDFEQLTCFGHHDFTCGYLRRETFWNWACFSTEVNGHTLGLNISRGVNETTWSENCAWLDGKLHLIGGCDFQFSRDRLFDPWHIKSVGDDSKNDLDLKFEPMQEHQEKLNLLVFASNFHQVFGRFTGSINIGGKQFKLDGIPGFVEDQYAKW